MSQEVSQYIRQYVQEDTPMLKELYLNSQERSDIQPCVEPELGKFLALLVLATGAQYVLEIGTGIGYSTLWLAGAVKHTGGHITSIERENRLYREAKANIDESGLASWVTLLCEDACQLIYQLTGPFDLVFQDARKENYPRLLEPSIRLTRKGGVIVADDTLFKATGGPRNLGEPVDQYNQAVFNDSRLYSTLLPIGDGVTISYVVE